MSVTAIGHRRRFGKRTAVVGAIRWYVVIVLAGFVTARWGIATQTFVILGMLTAITLMPLPSWVWAAAAFSVPILIRGLTRAGLLPGVMDFADFGLVYLGLCAVLIRHGIGDRRDARVLSASLLLLLGVTCISWVFNPSDLIRPFFAFSLWAEPFAFVLLLLVEPPDFEQQRILLGWFGMLVALQIPFAIYQWLTIGWSDPVVGTLLAAGGGAHTLASIGVLAGIALTTWAFSHSIGRGIAATVLAAPLMIGLPIITDAKQVIVSLPVAALVLVLAVRGVSRKLTLILPSVVTLMLLFWTIPAGRTARIFLEEAGEGRSGKLVALDVLRRELGGSVAGWALGVGPANGLSRAAYLTDPVYGREGSPVGLLRLQPAPLPPIAVPEALRASGDTSFNYPLSSLLGVLSDVGVIGLAAFGAVIASVVLPLWRRRRLWLAQTALAGWAMSIPLAATFDWWEQPPFMLTLALLTSLALTWQRARPPGGNVHGSRGSVVAPTNHA
jgi:hypothetical protein